MPVYTYDGDFKGPSIWQTKSIAYNLHNADGSVAYIRTATVNIPAASLSSTSDFQWFLSVDGGATWNQVTLGTLYTFNSPGTDLRLRVMGNPGATMRLGRKHLKVSYTAY